MTMAPWVRNAIALFTITIWGIYIMASFITGVVPEFYVWGIPVMILTGLPAIPVRKPNPPARPDAQEEST